MSSCSILSLWVETIFKYMHQMGISIFASDLCPDRKNAPILLIIGALPDGVLASEHPVKIKNNNDNANRTFCI